jgi:hypothetical protein
VGSERVLKKSFRIRALTKRGGKVLFSPQWPAKQSAVGEKMCFRQLSVIPCIAFAHHEAVKRDSCLENPNMRAYAVTHNSEHNKGVEHGDR